MDEQDWKALSRINESPEGRRLLSLLVQEREACRDSLERCRDPDEIARLQGRAAHVADLVEKLTSAKDVVNECFTRRG